tara:strand:- start:1031 stop:1636 length:606 start_codon:yes stop_codon:yes gene_type:complete
MASNINDTGVNSNYPVAGQDNDSQGFRDNFTVISSNFVAAKAEIEALQTNSAVKNADNNFLGNSIINADFKNTTETAYVAGSTVNTSQNVNLDNGAYQEFTVGADITLTLANWSSTTAKTGKVRIHVKSDQAAGSATNRTITFASNAGGGTLKRNTNWPTNDNTAVIGAPGVGEESKYYAFEFVSYDSGATVWAEYLGIYQ